MKLPFCPGVPQLTLKEAQALAICCLSGTWFGKSLGLQNSRYRIPLNLYLLQTVAFVLAATSLYEQHRKFIQK